MPESLDAAAQRYDRTRPSYPGALIDWITGDAPGRALDVGCDTGQLARLLVES